MVESIAIIIIIAYYVVIIAAYVVVGCIGSCTHGGIRVCSPGNARSGPARL